MKLFYENLKLELEKQLTEIQLGDDSSYYYVVPVLKILILSLERLIADCTSPTDVLVSKLFWTGSKVSLIELIYSLHTVGVVNNGNASALAITSVFETAFNIDLGHYRKKYVEIRARKSERTKFLTSLQDQLLQRMDDADSIAY